MLNADLKLFRFCYQLGIPVIVFHRFISNFKILNLFILISSSNLEIGFIFYGLVFNFEYRFLFFMILFSILNNSFEFFVFLYCFQYWYRIFNVYNRYSKSVSKLVIPHKNNKYEKNTLTQKHVLFIYNNENIYFVCNCKFIHLVS